MANTYELIGSQTLSGTASTVTFSSIPQTYTDLVVQVSARNNESDNATSLRCYFNGDTSNITVYEMRAIGSTAATYSISYAQAGYVAAAQSMSNSFGSASIYIPNYKVSRNKVSSGDIVQASSTLGENYLILSARSWSVNDAVTSITLGSGGGSWVQNSSFCLYGIKNT